MNLKNKRTKIIKTEAKKYGFISCGISKAEFLEDHAIYLEKWLKKKTQRKNVVYGKKFRQKIRSH